MNRLGFNEVKAISLDKVKQAREDIDELDGEFLTLYDGTNKLCSRKYVYIDEVLEILDKLIESEDSEDKGWMGWMI